MNGNINDMQSPCLQNRQPKYYSVPFNTNIIQERKYKQTKTADINYLPAGYPVCSSMKILNNP